jgi:hypothetical protein
VCSSHIRCVDLNFQFLLLSSDQMKEDVTGESQISYVGNEKFVHCYGNMKEVDHFQYLVVDWKIIV